MLEATEPLPRKKKNRAAQAERVRRELEVSCEKDAPTPEPSQLEVSCEG